MENDKDYNKLFPFFQVVSNELEGKIKKEKEKKERLIQLFNELFKILDISYGEFNRVMWMETEEQKEKLKALGKQYPELGIKCNGIIGDMRMGVSVVSLLATVTDILCGKRFAVRNEEGKGKITGCGFVKFNDDGSWEIEE
jgi:hypothetical protein